MTISPNTPTLYRLISNFLPTFLVVTLCVFTAEPLPVAVGPGVIVGDVVPLMLEEFGPSVGTEVLSVSVMEASAAVQAARPMEASLVQATSRNMS